MTIETENNGWDQTFLNLSSYTAEPFCQTYGLLRYRVPGPLGKVFDNYPTKAQELAFRGAILLGTAILGALAYTAPVPVIGGALAVGAASRLFRAIGFGLQTNGYTHVRGEGKEKEWDETNPTLRLMTWNICAIGGEMSKDHGGVIDWRYRIDQIANHIRDEDPDVVALQEIYDAAAGEALIARLKDLFPHFYIELGPNVHGGVGGTIVLSKYKASSFESTSFDNNTWSLNRTFDTLEIGGRVRIIGTHLIHGGEKTHEKRMEQVAQIIDQVGKRMLIPTILMGDLNTERARDGLLKERFTHGYTGDEHTCTNKFTKEWDPTLPLENETIDYISELNQQGVNHVTFSDVKIGQEGFDSTDALSDHRSLVATVTMR